MASVPAAECGLAKAMSKINGALRGQSVNLAEICGRLGSSPQYWTQRGVADNDRGMAGQLRIEYEGAIYHVLGRGNRREA